MSDLFKKIEKITDKENASKVTKVVVKLGALSHISADHFREHFVHAAQNTQMNGASLEIELCEDVNDPNAQDIQLISIDVE